MKIYSDLELEAFKEFLFIFSSERNSRVNVLQFRSKREFVQNVSENLTDPSVREITQYSVSVIPF